MTTNRLIAIGDVHGCFHALDAVLNSIEPTLGDRIVFLGDMVDSGKESREVLERIIALRQECDVVLIQGNHEEMMLAARESEDALNFWINCGGAPTLSSYRFLGSLSDVPDAHWELIEQCVPYCETDDHIFTHANYLPEVPMSEQPGHQLRWALFEPDEMQPHVSGKQVTVGHTEQRNGEIVDLGFARCIDTACYRYGWLTAVELSLAGHRDAATSLWQASAWGVLRGPGEETQRERLGDLLVSRP
jgi:serine/threonine protein phosphatase 1